MVVRDRLGPSRRIHLLLAVQRAAVQEGTQFAAAVDLDLVGAEERPLAVLDDGALLPVGPADDHDEADGEAEAPRPARDEQAGGEHDAKPPHPPVGVCRVRAHDEDDAGGEAAECRRQNQVQRVPHPRIGSHLAAGERRERHEERVLGRPGEDDRGRQRHEGAAQQAAGGNPQVELREVADRRPEAGELAVAGERQHEELTRCSGTMAQSGSVLPVTNRKASTTMATGSRKPAISRTIGGIDPKATTKVSRYSESGRIHSSGTGARSRVRNAVTDSSRPEGTAESSTHRARWRAVGAPARRAEPA
jgi:hypothetical protein